MITYIKLGKVRGLSIELKNDFGLKPFFQKSTFHHETIIDIPYVQIIYTGGKWTPVKRMSVKPNPVRKIQIRSASNVNVNEEANQTTERSGGANGN